MLGSDVVAQDTEEFATEEVTQPVAKKKKKARKAKKKGALVPKALKKLKRVDGKLNQKALMYVYLQSASWCGPCKKIMPDVVKMYKEMRKDGRVEVVLIGRDDTPDAVAAYIKGYKCKMPAYFSEDKKIGELPGFTKSGGIPHATIVDANGMVIGEGYPTMVLPNWERMVEKLEADAAAAAEAAEAEAASSETDSSL